MTKPDDFDPTDALDGWRAPVPVAVDLELDVVLRATGAGLDEAKKARLKARGYADIEDVEVSEVLPPAHVELPRHSLLARHPAADPRLLRHWQSLAWTGLTRRVRGARRPAGVQALRDLIEAERGASFARLNQGYARQGAAVRRRP